MRSLSGLAAWRYDATGGYAALSKVDHGGGLLWSGVMGGGKVARWRRTVGGWLCGVDSKRSTVESGGNVERWTRRVDKEITVEECRVAVEQRGE